MTIWKYAKALEALSDVIGFDMPVGAKVLSVVNQCEALTICALIDPEVDRTEKVLFRIVGTGHPVDGKLLDMMDMPFVGTVVFQSGALVFHVFRVK